MIKNLKKTKNITTKNKIKSSELKTTTKTTTKNCNKIEKNLQNKNVKLKKNIFFFGQRSLIK